MNEIMTTKEVSEFLKVSILTLRRWHKTGKLKGIVVSTRGDRRYKAEDIKKLLGITK